MFILLSLSHTLSFAYTVISGVVTSAVLISCLNILMLTFQYIDCFDLRFHHYDFKKKIYIYKIGLSIHKREKKNTLKVFKRNF